MRRAAIGAIAGILISAATGAHFAATEASPARSSDDTLAALLVEVKTLRAAIEQLAGAGAQVQLSVARLQIEEGRINTLIRRLDDVREKLTNARHEVADLAAQQERVDKALSENAMLQPAEREAMSESIAQAKREIARKDEEIARLTGDEAQLSADIATAQARWAEFSRRLDELDRAFAKR